MQLKLGDFFINIRSLPNEIKMCRMWTSNVAHQAVAVYACAEVAKTPISNVKLHAHVYVFVGLCAGEVAPCHSGLLTANSWAINSGRLVS